MERRTRGRFKGVCLTYLKYAEKFALTGVQTLRRSVCGTSEDVFSPRKTKQNSNVRWIIQTELWSGCCAQSELPLVKTQKTTNSSEFKQQFEGLFLLALSGWRAVKTKRQWAEEGDLCSGKPSRVRALRPCSECECEPWPRCSSLSPGSTAGAGRRHQVLIYITAPAVSNHSCEQGVWLNIPARASSNQSPTWAGAVSLSTL